MTTKLDDLSPDALVYLALTMDMPDIVSLCLTSNRFNEYVCANSNFWQRRLKKDYDLDKVPDDKTYKDYYQEIYESYRRAGDNPNRKIMSAVYYGIKRDILDMLKNEKISAILFVFQGALQRGYDDIVKYIVDNKLINLRRHAKILYLPSDNITLFKYLVENGANINSYNSDYDLGSGSEYGYPLEYAVRKKQRQIAKYLADLGAKPAELRDMLV